MARAEIDIKIGAGIIPFRMGIAEIEELEEVLDMSAFVALAAISAELPFLKASQWREILRIGMIGGGMDRPAAEFATDAMMEEQEPALCVAVAIRVLSAGLGRVHGDKDDPTGEMGAARSNASISPPSTVLPQ